MIVTHFSVHTQGFERTVKEVNLILLMLTDIF